MKITLPTLRVLGALLENPGEPHFGYSLMQATGLKPGTLYPMLSRLTAEGWVTREQEDIDPVAEGRPARRYYKLTPLGIQESRQARAEAYEAIAPQTGILSGHTTQAALHDR